jgi:hypothetical protein
MLQVFYLDVAYVLQWFLSVSCVFCKYFRRMFQTFHLSLDVCCKCVLRYFRSRLGVASHFSPWCLLLAFFSLASMSDYGGGAAEAGGGGAVWT